MEVDGLLIVEISKFNYLFELVKGKFSDDIFGFCIYKKDTNRLSGFFNKYMGRILRFIKF